MPKTFMVEPYSVQVAQWPTEGRHILAQFDADSVVVYQAYKPAIGQFAATNGHFGGEFNFQRTSWIKPNFLWMMYRNGWGSKPNQEVTLAIWLKRTVWDTILNQAVHSYYQPICYASEAAWKRALEQSDMVMQWDPDHDPLGAKLARRAVQLGLRGETLRQYAHAWIVDIQDISAFVHQQVAYTAPAMQPYLHIPTHAVYPVSDMATRARYGLEQDSDHEPS